MDGALLRAAFVASCFLGAFPPVDLRAVCLVRAIVQSATKKKKKYSIDVRIVAHTVDAPRARRSAETQKQIKIINKIRETRELFRQTEQSKLHAIIRVKRCSSRAAIETGRAEWGGDLASDWPGECSGTAQRGKSSRCAMERSRVRPVYLRQRANKNSQRWKKKRREQERSRFFVNRTSPTVSRFARVR